MSALATLTDHGLHVESQGDKLIVSPASGLNDELRAYIRDHKLEIMAILTDVDTLIRAACKGLRVTPEQFRAICTEQDLSDIRNGGTPPEALRVFAIGIADGIATGRIKFHPRACILVQHEVGPWPRHEQPA